MSSDLSKLKDHIKIGDMVNYKRFGTNERKKSGYDIVPCRVRKKLKYIMVLEPIRNQNAQIRSYQNGRKSPAFRHGECQTARYSELVESEED